MPDALPPPLVRRLRSIVGESAVIDRPARLLAYESDALTAYRRTPRAVILPADTMEAAGVLTALHEAGLAVVARGAGTGLSGGALADGSVIVATTRMTELLELDVQNRRARVQAGLVNARLSTAAAPHGLYYAPDPSSQSTCTIGGNVAENSGGPHCLKYGVTSRYVRGITLVLPDGEVAELGGVGSGEDYDLVGLVVGSEGCFGLVTEVEVGLLPLPEAVRTLLAIFDELEDAGRAVTDIIADGLLPAALEIIDREVIRAVEASVFAAGYPVSAGAVLVIEFDGTEAGLDAEIAAAAEWCKQAGASEIRSATSAEERTALWQGRKKAFGAMGRIAPDLLIQDATVPRSRLPEVLRTVSRIGESYDLTIANVFHAGDGNLHPKILFDRRIPEQLAKVERASREIMQACVDVGGTITGEHGVGADKRGYMPMVHSPEELSAMADVKGVFDPGGRFNPGKVLPDGVERSPAYTPTPGANGGRPPLAVTMRDLVGEGGVAVVAAGEGQGAPMLSVRPTELNLVAEVMRTASARGWSVLPVGSGLGPDTVEKASEADIVLKLDAFDGVSEYEPADLTITAGAGISLGALDGVTRPEGQWLAVDPPGGPTASLGGVVSLGLGGSLEAAFGLPRDQVLGMTCVTGDGRVLRLGGKVVKNVAGFDLVRLLVGSRGTLGVITDVTTRLFPVPALERSLVLEGASAARLLPAALRIAAAPFVPAGLDLLEDPGLPDGAVLIVRLLGSEPAVEAEVAELRRRVPELDDAPGDVVSWASRLRTLEEGGELCVRYTLPPSRVAEALRRLPESPPGAEGGELTAPHRIAVHVGSGVVRVVWPSAVGVAGDRSRSRAVFLGADLGVSPWTPGVDPAVTDLSASGLHRLRAGLRESFDPGGALRPGVRAGA